MDEAIERKTTDEVDEVLERRRMAMGEVVMARSDAVVEDVGILESV